MEPPSANIDRGQKKLQNSPQRLFPFLNNQNVVLPHRGLSWLRSLHRDNPGRPPAIKNVLAKKIKRTPAHQIKLEVEELDQINHNLDKALTQVRKFNERLKRKFEEEKGALDQIITSFEMAWQSNEPIPQKGKSPLKSSFYGRKFSQHKLQNKLLLNFDKRINSEHVQIQMRIQSQSDANSQALSSPTNVIKTPKRFMMIDKDFRISPRSLLKHENVFEIAKTEKKRFEVIVREILADGTQHPTSNDHLMKSISLLNFHISELQKRISKRHRNPKYYEMMSLMLSNREMMAEFTRLSGLYSRITQEADSKAAKAVPVIKASNNSLQEEINELEELIKLADREIHYTEGAIDQMELEISSAEKTLDKTLKQNEVTAGEIARYDNEIQQLLAQIAVLSDH